MHSPGHASGTVCPGRTSRLAEDHPRALGRVVPDIQILAPLTPGRPFSGVLVPDPAT